MDNSLKGTVFNIQRMSLHDGSGIRTVVFLKGCNNRCFWCHNPESWDRGQEIQFFPERCIGCGQCLTACPNGLHKIDADTKKHIFDRESCKHCGLCAANCPSGCLVFTGKDYSADEIIPLLLRDKPFYDRSNGGVTISGGEPLIQLGFVKSLLRKLKEISINTAIESAFNVRWESIEDIRQYTDFFLVDLKTADDDKHRSVTGSSNKQIIENIIALDKTGSKYCIRIPVIPGVNDDVSSMEGIYNVLKHLSNISYVELMPYHTMGIGKLASLSLSQSQLVGLKPPAKEQLALLAATFTDISVRY